MKTDAQVRPYSVHFLGSGYAVFKGREEVGGGDSARAVSQNSAVCVRSSRAADPGPVDIPRAEGYPRPQPASRLFFPRKEVIQPHLPVRLPCYDFTPVTGPTFDGSLP